MNQDPPAPRSGARTRVHPLVAPASALFRVDPLFRPHAAYAFELEDEADPDGLLRPVQDRRLRRSAALETLPPTEQSPERCRRFLRRAQILSRLGHPAIPAVYEFGRSPTGDLYLLTKRVRGETLADRMRSHELRRRPASAIPSFIRVFVRVCEALGYAHERGIIHRELAPEQIILGRHGEVFVQGWNLARDQDETLANDRSLRRALGADRGGREFAAPELSSDKEVDGRADIYSIGAMIHAILAGGPPGIGRSALPETSALGELALSCLNPDPQRRPEDARSLAQALRSLGSSERRPLIGLRSALVLAAVSGVLLGAVLVERSLARARHQASAELRRRELTEAADARRKAAARLAELVRARRQPEATPPPPSPPAPKKDGLDDEAIRRLLRDAAIRERREGPSAALAQVDALLKRAPRSARALFYRAVLYRRTGRHRRAVADLTSVLAIDPSQFGAYVNRGSSKVELKDFKGALEDFQVAIDARHKLDETYNNRGLCKRAMGDLDGAIADYDRSIAENPRFAMAYSNRGLARALKREYTLALRDYDRALELDPGKSAYINNRAKSLLALGRASEARASLEKLLSDEPKDLPALTTLSGLALQDKDYAAAIAHARRALEVDPKAHRARTNLAVSLSFQEEHAAAITEANRSLARDSRDFRALYARGRSARAIGVKARALTDLRALQKLVPGFRKDEIAGWIRELEAP